MLEIHSPRCSGAHLPSPTVLTPKHLQGVDGATEAQWGKREEERAQEESGRAWNSHRGLEISGVIIIIGLISEMYWIPLNIGQGTTYRLFLITSFELPNYLWETQLFHNQRNWDTERQSLAQDLLTSNCPSLNHYFVLLCIVYYCTLPFYSIAGLLKSQCTLESPEGLVKANSWAHTGKFWFHRPRVGPMNLHFFQVPRWGWCCWSGDHTLRSKV